MLGRAWCWPSVSDRPARYTAQIAALMPRAFNVAGGGTIPKERPHDINDIDDKSRGTVRLWSLKSFMSLGLPLSSRGGTPAFRRPPVRFLARSGRAAFPQQQHQSTLDVGGFRVAREHIADVRSRHPVRLPAECGQDGVGDRIAQRVAEDEAGGLLGVAPALKRGLKVRGADGLGSVQGGVGQGEARNLCFGAGRDSPEQPRPAIGQASVFMLPEPFRIVVKGCLRLAPFAHDRDVLPQPTGQVAPVDAVATEGELSRPLHCNEQKTVGEPVSVLGFLKIAAQLVAVICPMIEMCAPVAFSGEFLVRF